MLQISKNNYSYDYNQQFVCVVICGLKFIVHIVHPEGIVKQEFMGTNDRTGFTKGYQCDCGYPFMTGIRFYTSTRK